MKLPKNVREFIIRDLIYIVGGGIVITTFLHRFGRLPNQDTPLVFYLLGAGIAYVVGSTVQDIFSIFRLVTTAHITKLYQPWKWCYERFTAEKWNDIKDFDPSKARQAIRSLKNNDQVYAAAYERAISGLILAATMAPCSLLSSLIPWWKWYVCRNQFDFCLAVVVLILSAGLFILARVRGAQITRIDADAIKEYCTKFQQRDETGTSKTPESTQNSR